MVLTLRNALEWLRRPPSLTPNTEGREWKIAFIVRYVGVIAMGLMAATVPMMGPNRYWLAGYVAVGGTIYNSIAHWYAAHHQRAWALMPLIDTIIGVIAIAIEPNALLPAMLVMVTVVAVTAVSFGRRTAGLATAFASVLLAIVISVTDVPRGSVGLAGFVISGAMVSVAVGSLAEREYRQRTYFGTLVEGLDAIVWDVEPKGFGYRYVSPMAEELLGYPVSAWTENNFWWEHVHPDDRKIAYRTFRTNVGLGQDHDLEYRIRAADGRWVHFHDRIAVELDAAGQPTKIRGVTVDVSEQRKVEERVGQYADIVERIQVALMILRPEEDADGSALHFVAANPMAERAIGIPRDRMLGFRLDDVLPQLLATPLPDVLWDVIRTGRAYDQSDVLLGPGNESRVFSMHAFPLPGNAVGVSLDDVTSASMAADALRRQALHDDLTGLPNRTMLKARLREAIAESERTGRKLALLILDLNQFKEVNDALGHHHGDLLLRSLSRRLHDELPDCDLVARLGGDEFAVLYRDRVTLASTIELAERIGRALQEPFQIEDLTLQTNASIGLALFPDHAADSDSLTQRADVAMYLAKRTGVGHAVYTAEQDHSSIRRLTLLGELRRGLELNEFVLHYQPVIDLATGRAVRVEALIRWRHPEHGLMPPQEFIPLAEVSGVIQPLTRWVLEQAISAAGRWRRAGAPLAVAVNLSVRNLYDPELARYLAGQLQNLGVPAEELMVEITESELMEDPQLAREVLDELHQLGVAAAIDDFGTGYSSLTYLKDLPIRQIKIDRTFVEGIGAQQKDLAIVRSMIDLGHSLGLEVVAEGVSDVTTLDHLISLGCDFAQGFLLGRPMTEDELPAWLAEHQINAPLG